MLFYQCVDRAFGLTGPMFSGKDDGAVIVDMLVGIDGLLEFSLGALPLRCR